MVVAAVILARRFAERKKIDIIIVSIIHAPTSRR
jgi:hypothetical protein